MKKKQSPIAKNWNARRNAVRDSGVPYAKDKKKTPVPKEQLMKEYAKSKYATAKGKAAVKRITKKKG